MRFTIERSDLLKATGIANSVADRQNAKIILGFVLIESRDDRVTFRAANSTIEVIATCDAVVETPGAATVNAATLNEIARKLPSGCTVNISLEALEPQDQITVEAANAVFRLGTLAWEDFPVMPEHEFSCRFALPVSEFDRLINMTRFAICEDETRRYLNGTYLHIYPENEPDALRAVTTDGHRLALAWTDLPEGAEGMPGVILPKRTVLELGKIISADDEVVNLSVSPNLVRFEMGRLVLTSGVIDARYPDYTRVIPPDNTIRLDVDRAGFIHAVDRVSTVSLEQDSQAVAVSLERDRIKLNLNARESGTADEVLAAAYDGDDMVIGFNCSYLMDLAQSLRRDRVIFMLASPTQPAIARDGDDEKALFVVMPMRV
ncbi:MAG: DNA polymerase III subunit beta [Paracoccaceae bacterium]|nr:DNA polymerase III subunit beta [Paracoccaceae bacterium]